MPEQAGFIIRVDHSREHPYVPVSRKTIRDMGLDLQAKGFLVYLLAKPDNWCIKPKALAAELKVGKDTIYRMMNRLLRAGYAHRELIKRNNQGRFETGSIYVIFEDRDYRREWEQCRRFTGTNGSLGDMPNAKIPF